MAVVAELLVRIGVDAKALESGISGVNTTLGKIGAGMTEVGGQLTAGLTAPLVAAGVAALGSALKVGQLADELLDLVDQTGLSTDALQEFRHVAVIAGVAPDTLANAAIKLTTALQGSGEQSKQVAGALAQLGVSATDASGGLLPMDQLLPSILAGLQGMDDTTQRNVLAADLFGRSWAELAPIMGLGAEGMADARAEAQSLGLVLSGEGLEAADQFRQQWETLKAVLSASASQVGVALIPALTALATVSVEHLVPALVSVVEFIGRMADGWAALTPQTQGFIGAVAGLAVTIGPLLLVGGKLITMILGLNPVTVGVVAVLGTLIAVGVAVTENWNVLSFEAKRLRDIVSGAFETMGDAVGGVLGAISDGFVRFIREPVADLVDGIGQLKSDVVARFLELKDDVVGKVTETGAKVVQFLVTNLITLPADMASKVFGPAVARFVTFKTEVIRLVTETYNGIKQWLLDKFTAIVDSVKVQVDRVRDFFAGLKDTLVGHSIVVDMVDDIGGEFERMGVLMETETATAVSDTTTAFGGLSGTLDTIAGAELGLVLDKFKGLGITLPKEVEGLVGKLGEKWGAIKSVLELPLIDTFASTLEKWRGYAEGIIDIIKGVWNAVGKFIEMINKFFDKGGQFGGPFGGGQFGDPGGINTSSVPMTPFGDPASADLLSRIADTLDAIEDKEWSPQITVNVQGGSGAWSSGAGSGSASIAGIDQQLGIMGQRRNVLLTGDNSI